MISRNLYIYDNYRIGTEQTVLKLASLLRKNRMPISYDTHFI